MNNKTAKVTENSKFESNSNNSTCKKLIKNEKQNESVDCLLESEKLDASCKTSDVGLMSVKDSQDSSGLPVETTQGTKAEGDKSILKPVKASKNPKVKQRATANKKFLGLFTKRLNCSNEILVDSFNCALLRNNSHLLLQGTLYVTKRFYGFYSNIFGYQTYLCGKWSDVVNLGKENVALIFPTAISFKTRDNEQFLLASFISRSQAFKIIHNLWKEENCLDKNDTSIQSELLPSCVLVKKEQEEEEETESDRSNEKNTHFDVNHSSNLLTNNSSSFSSKCQEATIACLKNTFENSFSSLSELSNSSSLSINQELTQNNLNKTFEVNSSSDIDEVNMLKQVDNSSNLKLFNANCLDLTSSSNTLFNSINKQKKHLADGACDNSSNSKNKSSLFAESLKFILDCFLLKRIVFLISNLIYILVKTYVNLKNALFKPFSLLFECCKDYVSTLIKVSFLSSSAVCKAVKPIQIEQLESNSETSERIAVTIRNNSKHDTVKKENFSKAILQSDNNPGKLVLLRNKCSSCNLLSNIFIIFIFTVLIVTFYVYIFLILARVNRIENKLEELLNKLLI
jgi:hypothetical protein